MKIVSLRNKQSQPVFVRVSNTEGQLHYYSKERNGYVPSHWIEGTKSEVDSIEELHNRMAELYVGGEPEFITIVSAMVVADTVEGMPNSEVRPTACQNPLAGPNKALG